MQTTILTCLTFVTLVTVARSENNGLRINTDIENTPGVRFFDVRSRPNSETRFDSKLRGKRTLLLLMPGAEEENGESKDEEQTTRKSQKTKRCKSPIRRMRISPLLGRNSLDDENRAIPGPRGAEGFYGDERNSKEYRIERGPNVRLVSLRDPKTMQNTVLKPERREKFVDRAGNIGLLKAIRGNAGSRDHEADDFDGGTGEKSVPLEDDRYICYCREKNGRQEQPRKDTTRNSPPQQYWLTKKSRMEKNNGGKPRFNEDARRRRPIYVDIPDHRLISQRLPILYADIPHVPKYTTNNLVQAVEPSIQQSRKNMDNVPYLPYFYDLQPQFEVLPTGNLQRMEKQEPVKINIPFTSVDDRSNYIVGLETPHVQGHKENFDKNRQNTERKSCPPIVGKDRYESPPKLNRPIPESDTVGKSWNDYTTRDPELNSRDSIYYSTPVGSTSIDIDECIKLYGRDVCVISATSSRTSADVRGNREDYDYTTKFDAENVETNYRSNEVSRTYGSPGYTTAYYDSVDDYGTTLTGGTEDKVSRGGNRLESSGKIDSIYDSQRAIENSSSMGSFAADGVTVDPVVGVDRSNSATIDGAPIGRNIDEHFTKEIGDGYVTSTGFSVENEIAGRTVQFGNNFNDEEFNKVRDAVTNLPFAPTIMPGTRVQGKSNVMPPDSQETYVGQPHTGLGSEHVAGPELFPSETLDYSEIKEVTTAYFTSKAYANETNHTNFHLNVSGPSSYDDFYITSTGPMNDVNLQSRLELTETTQTLTPEIDTKEIETEIPISKTSEFYTTQEPRDYVLGKSQVSTNEGTSANIDENYDVEYRTNIANEDGNNYNDEGASSLEEKNIVSFEAATPTDENDALSQTEKLHEDEVPGEGFAEEIYSTQSPEVEDDTSLFDEKYEPSRESDEITSVDQTVVEEEKSAIPDSPMDEVMYPATSRSNDYSEKTEYLENSNEKSVGAIEPATDTYDEENDSLFTPMTEQRNENEEIGTAKNVLPFCDNSLLQSSIKRVINNFATSDSDESENEGSEQIVGSANENLLPEILEVPNLKGILSLPQIESTIVKNVKGLLSKITGVSSETFENDRATNAIRSSLRHMMSVAPASDTELPPMTVEEHEFKNGVWTTHLVTLSPIVNDEEHLTGEEKLRGHIKNLLLDPSVNLQAARKPIVKNMIVQSVRNSFKPENVTSDGSSDDSMIRGVLEDVLNEVEGTSTEDSSSTTTEVPFKPGQWILSNMDEEEGLEVPRIEGDKGLDEEGGNKPSSSQGSSATSNFDENKTTEGVSVSKEVLKSSTAEDVREIGQSSTEWKFLDTAKIAVTQSASDIDAQQTRKAPSTDQKAVSHEKDPGERKILQPGETLAKGISISTKFDGEETLGTTISSPGNFGSESTAEPLDYTFLGESREGESTKYTDLSFTEVGNYDVYSTPTTEFRESAITRGETTETIESDARMILSETPKDYDQELENTSILQNVDDGNEFSEVSDSSNILGIARIDTTDSTTASSYDKLRLDEDNVKIATSYEEEEVLKTSSIPILDPERATDENHRPSAKTVSDDSGKNGKDSIEKSPTKYYCPEDRILEYIKNHRTSTAKIQESTDVEDFTRRQSDADIQEITTGSDLSYDMSNEKDTTRNGMDVSNTEDDYLGDGRKITESYDSVSPTIFTQNAGTQGEGTLESTSKTINAESFTPTSNVYQPTEFTEQTESAEIEESLEDQKFKTTTSNIKESPGAPRKKPAAGKALQSKIAATTSRNGDEFFTVRGKSYLPTTEDFLKTHEVTTEIQKKVTKTTRYFEKVRNDQYSTNDPITSDYSAEDENFTKNYDVYEDDDEGWSGYVGAPAATPVSTRERSRSYGEDRPKEDFTYLGKISVENKANGPEDMQNLRKSELYYVGDGVKLPLEIRKLSDGSYALSISRKVCEHILDRDCPCCVPLEGSVVRSVRRNTEGSTSNSRRITNRSGGNVRRRIPKQQSQKPDDVNDRKKRDSFDDTLIISMPVRAFAKKYNLSLNLGNAQTPWNMDGKEYNKRNVARTKKRLSGYDLGFSDRAPNEMESNANSRLFQKLFSIHEASQDRKSAIEPSNILIKPPSTNMYAIVDGKPIEIGTFSSTARMDPRKYDRYADINEDATKYGYQEDNTVFDRITFGRKKKMEPVQYRYQRNVNEKSNKRVEVMKSVLNWLKGVFLSADQITSTDR